MSRKIIYRIFRPVFWLHEQLHLLPARAFGINARIAPDYESVIFDNLSAHHPLQVAITLLTPALAGLIVLVGVVRAWSLAAQAGLGIQGHINWFCVVWVCYGWIAGCADDIWQVWNYQRCRQWRARTSREQE